MISGQKSTLKSDLEKMGVTVIKHGTLNFYGYDNNNGLGSIIDAGWLFGARGLVGSSNWETLVEISGAGVITSIVSPVIKVGEAGKVCVEITRDGEVATFELGAMATQDSRLVFGPVGMPQSGTITEPWDNVTTALGNYTSEGYKSVNLEGLEIVQAARAIINNPANVLSFDSFLKVRIKKEDYQPPLNDGVNLGMILYSVSRAQ